MITVSIVSHGHGLIVPMLVNQLLSCSEISLIIITFNIPENVNLFPLDPKILYINNKKPKGYGSNHNAAFGKANSRYFCVLNPDIELIENPFPSLIRCLKISNAKLVAPTVISKLGEIEDSMRYSPTIKSLLKKLFFGDDGRHHYSSNENTIYPDWVAGMFMLFDSTTYQSIGGFDESFFMYYEDVDICERIRKSENILAGDLSISVIHDAQRASRKNFKHMLWHLSSMIRYLWRYR